MTQVFSLFWLVHDALVDWLAHGLWDSSWWWTLIYAAAATHTTIAAVTIYLHRSQAHLALELHPYVSHFFRLWLWLTTGMITKEWVAIHRKHHAKCETRSDPHSPQTRGIKKVLFEGAELYRAEAKVRETLEKYGRNTPDDWVERHLYSRYPWQGVGLLLILDLLLFGAIGMTVWAFQMAWIPITAAGIINGLGHWWGYRNFESPDASTNILPWGIIIGGEELHNNHHTYPTSAKLSVKPWEFDIGWVYIRLLELCRLVTVKHVAPKLVFVSGKTECDEGTLKAVISLRYQLMAQFNRLARSLDDHDDRVEVWGLRNRLARLWLKADLREQVAVEGLEIWRDRACQSRIPAIRNLAQKLPGYVLQPR